MTTEKLLASVAQVNVAPALSRALQLKTNRQYCTLAVLYTRLMKRLDTRCLTLRVTQRAKDARWVLAHDAHAE